MGITSLISDAWSLYRRNSKFALLMTATSLTGEASAAYLLVTADTETENLLLAAFAFLLAVAAVAVTPLLDLAALRGAECALRGESIHVGETCRWAFRRIWNWFVAGFKNGVVMLAAALAMLLVGFLLAGILGAVLGGTFLPDFDNLATLPSDFGLSDLLRGLAPFLGLFVALVAAAWLGQSLMQTFYIVLLEDAPLGAAVRQSVARMRGHMWLGLLLTVLARFALVMNKAADRGYLGHGAVALGILLGAALLDPFARIMCGLFYFRLRPTQSPSYVVETEQAIPCTLPAEASWA